jgi:hypothetical protein
MHVSRVARTLVSVVVAVTLGVSLPAAVTAQGQSAAPYRYLDFMTIANFTYNPKAAFDPMPPKATGTIPASVLALNGKKVRVLGNAMALDYSSGYMTEFILQSSVDNCGFGAEPRINEWLYIKMAPGLKARIYTGIEMEVSGTFYVKEEIENGRVVSLYSMVADLTK